MRQGIPESRLSNTHKKSACRTTTKKFLGVKKKQKKKKYFRFFACDHTMKPLLEIARLHTSTFLHLHFLEPANGTKMRHGIVQ